MGVGVRPDGLAGCGPEHGAAARTSEEHGGTALAPESIEGIPVTVVVIWILCAAGWGVVLAGLRRGLRGRERGPALFAHTVTPAGVVLTFAVLGYGSLYATIALAAEWWSLAAVTGFRPARLVAGGGLRRLAAWLLVTAAVTYVTGRLVLGR